VDECIVCPVYIFARELSQALLHKTFFRYYSTTYPKKNAVKQTAAAHIPACTEILTVADVEPEPVPEDTAAVPDAPVAPPVPVATAAVPLPAFVVVTVWVAEPADFDVSPPELVPVELDPAEFDPEELEPDELDSGTSDEPELDADIVELTTLVNVELPKLPVLVVAVVVADIMEVPPAVAELADLEIAARAWAQICCPVDWTVIASDGLHDSLLQSRIP
jgi:hypothetical protein